MTGSFSLPRKNIVITGASSGIGRCVAIECSKAGADLLLMGRNHERLLETLNRLSPGNHDMVTIDLSDHAIIESTLAPLLLKRGPVHGMVHAAGAELTSPFSMTRPKHFEALFAINVIAGFELARVLSRKQYTDQQAGGSFIFISSIRALYGQEGAVAYAASKGAVLSGMRSLALELAPRKIRVNAISPSIVKTPMTDSLFDSIPGETVTLMQKQHPLGFGEAVDVALASVYLLSDAGRWMTGNNLVLDGGYSIR